MMSVFARQSMQQRGGVAQQMLSDLGPGMHPRISIRGGSFALLDASGQRYGAPVILQQTPQGQKVAMLAIIIGSNPNRSRVYFEGEYDPDNPGPPDCFSDNGVAPSTAASTPQARTCAECEWGKWGSDRSKLTGKKTKLCSDKKKIGILVVGDPTKHVYELQVPPATLKNMAKYVGNISGYAPPGCSRKADPADFVTAISFEPGQTGILEFAPHAWLNSCYIDADGAIKVTYNAQMQPLNATDGGEAVGSLIDDIWASDELDEILGLQDKPWTPPALSAPLPGMTGYLEPQGHGGALQRGNAPTPVAQVQHQPQAQAQAAPPNPYAPPPGAVAQAAPQAFQPAPQQQPAPAAQAAPATRGRGRRTAAATTQAPALAAPGAAPVSQSPPVDVAQADAIPAFLQRARQEAGNAGQAPVPQSGAAQSFGNGQAPAPGAAVQSAVEAAFSLSTARS
jgi:hypothetical protein